MTNARALASASQSRKWANSVQGAQFCGSQRRQKGRAYLPPWGAATALSPQVAPRGSRRGGIKSGQPPFPPQPLFGFTRKGPLAHFPDSKQGKGARPQGLRAHTHREPALAGPPCPGSSSLVTHLHGSGMGALFMVPEALGPRDCPLLGSRHGWPPVGPIL